MTQDIGAPQISPGKVLWIAWCIMAVCPLAYLALGWLAEGYPSPNLPDAWRDETLLSVFYATAIVLFATTLLLRAQADTSAAAGASLVRSLIIFSACELIGVLGLALYWLTRERDAFYLLLATSLVALAIHRPRTRPDDFT